jgi:hypothetical protein
MISRLFKYFNFVFLYIEVEMCASSTARRQTFGMASFVVTEPGWAYVDWMANAGAITKAVKRVLR